MDLILDKAQIWEHHKVVGGSQPEMALGPNSEAQIQGENVGSPINPVDLQ